MSHKTPPKNPVNVVADASVMSMFMLNELDRMRVPADVNDAIQKLDEWVSGDSDVALNRDAFRVVFAYWMHQVSARFCYHTRFRA